jgi:alcohol dehydrogenase (cytochrome c)
MGSLKTAGTCAAIAGALLFTAQARAQLFARPASFTAAQATQGKAAYAGSCMMCHGEDLAGSGAAPALKGAQFQAQWHNLRPDGLYAFIVGQMPPNAGGSLDPKVYTAITAYIMQANGGQPGSAQFNPDAASTGQQGGVPGLARFIRRDATYDAVMAQRQQRLAQLQPVTDAMLAQPPAGDWLIWRRNYASTGYSPLRQINRGNASKLHVAWSWSLPLGGNEMTPLVHDGVIFIKSGDHVQAIDGEHGDLLWQYVRPYPAWMHDGVTEIVKNLAIYDNMLYVPFLDGHLVALDVKTGKVVWDHVLIGAEESAGRLPGPFDSPDAQHFLMVADGGPLVARGEVIIGVAGCSNQYQGGCFIVGLNGHTGHEDWRFHTIARPGQPGGDSWNGAPVQQRFGGSVWFSGSYDPKLDLVYFGTGQTYKTSTLLLPQASKGQSNDALYTDSTLALDPASGRLAWYYQHFRADIWDLDWSFERTLMSLPINGVNHDLVVTAGKIGIFDALDRSNGHYEFSRNLGLQNIVTAIDPHTGRKSIDPQFMPASGKDTTDRHGRGVCPYARDEPSTAYDPATYVIYIPVMDNSCPRPPGSTFDGKYGQLEALNLATGKVEWKLRQRATEVSSVLATAGGVVFDGQMDRTFRAVDARDGKVLWHVRLNSAPKTSPVTYTVGGRQYIAVVAGGAVLNTGAGPTSELTVPTDGETLWIFALPDDGRGGRAD